MTTQYSDNKFMNAVNGFAQQFCETVLTATLTEATATTLTVPGRSSLGTVNATRNPKFVAVFSYEPSKIVFVANNTTAALPAGASFAASSSELLPDAKIVRAGDVLSIISKTGTADVSVALYAIQE